MDPKITQKTRSSEQRKLRVMVEREVTAILKATGRGPQTNVEEALVRAIYSPDRRLTPQS